MFLYVAQDDVVMYGDRVVIPTSLRKRVLGILHSAHQGIRYGSQDTGTALLARIATEIQKTQDQLKKSIIYLFFSYCSEKINFDLV